MENFPQTYEPTGSQSILEQFVGLKNFMKNKLNSNEYVKTTKQTLTEEEKAQARENIGAGASTINIIDNLTSQSNIDALSANQGRVLNEKIDSSVQILNQTISQNVNELQQDIDANGGDIASLQGDVSELNQEIQRTLKTPMNAPSITELVGINVNNAQVSVSVENGLHLENGVLSGMKSELVLQGQYFYGADVVEQLLNIDLSKYKFVEFITTVKQSMFIDLSQGTSDCSFHIIAEQYYNGSWHSGIKCQVSYYLNSKQLTWSGNYCGLLGIKGWW